MATFKFNSEIPLYYSDLGIEFASDDTYEFDEAPDHNWSELESTEQDESDDSSDHE